MKPWSLACAQTVFGSRPSCSATSLASAQGRSGRRWSYGTNAARQAVTDGLAAAGLACLTEVDLVESGAISEPSHVEHICASTDLRQVGPVWAWDRIDEMGTALSDHPTIAVDLAPSR